MSDPMAPTPQLAGEGPPDGRGIATLNDHVADDNTFVEQVVVREHLPAPIEVRVYLVEFSPRVPALRRDRDRPGCVRWSAGDLCEHMAQAANGYGAEGQSQAVTRAVWHTRPAGPATRRIDLDGGGPHCGAEQGQRTPQHPPAARRSAQRACPCVESSLIRQLAPCRQRAGRFIWSARDDRIVRSESPTCNTDAATRDRPLGDRFSRLGCGVSIAICERRYGLRERPVDAGEGHTRIGVASMGRQGGVHAATAWGTDCGRAEEDHGHAFAVRFEWTVVPSSGRTSIVRQQPNASRYQTHQAAEGLPSRGRLSYRACQPVEPLIVQGFAPVIGTLHFVSVVPSMRERDSDDHPSNGGIA